MADSIQAAAREELVGAIAALLPEEMPFFNAQKAQRINWRVLVEMFQKGKADGLTAPWAVIWAGPATATDQFGITNDAFIQNFTIWWVEEFRSQNGTVRGTHEVRKAIEDGLGDIRRLLMSSVFTNFAAMSEGRIDASESTQSNDFFVKSNLPYQAGELSFQIMFGEQIAHD